MSSTGHHLFVTTSTHSTKDIRTPNASNPPHTDPPATVESPDTLTLAPALQDGLPKQLLSLFAFWRRATDAFFVDNAPDSSDNAAENLRGGHDGLDGLWGLADGRWTVCGGHRALLPETRGGVAGNLGPTQHGFEREADGEFQTRAKEGKEAPHGGVNDGIKREVGLQEKRCGGEDEVGQTGV